MENCRQYGTGPFGLAVVHGGPGAAGTMAPVARELARWRGILEPLQTADSLEGQLDELRTVLTLRARPPVILIGHSWGAWLGLLLAARHASLVKKLILVGCPPLTEAAAATIMPTRLSRLDSRQRDRLERINQALATARGPDRDALLAAFGALLAASDAYDPLPPETTEDAGCQEHIFRNVWPQAQALRRDGRLLAAARSLRCPVLAIHGAYDPHPAAGVKEPLSKIVKDFDWFLLQQCGHDPWQERQARDTFFRILGEEIES